MGAIFVSYRRGDSEGQARALFNELAGLIGKDSVFMDVDSIALGRDFRQILQERLGSSDLMLALIGPDWLDVRDASGNRRLESAADFVRQEIAAALKRNIPVTPVLVRGAQMPAPERLPDDLKDLAYRNGFELSHTRWESDVREMIKRLGLAKGDVQESRQPVIGAREADRPVVMESGPVVAGRTLGSKTIAIGAGATLLVLASLVAWLMSGGSNSIDQGTNLAPNRPAVETTSTSPTAVATPAATNETRLPAQKVAPEPTRPNSSPAATRQELPVAVSPPPKSTTSMSGTWDIVQTFPDKTVLSGTLELTQRGTTFGGEVTWRGHRPGEVVGGSVDGEHVEFVMRYEDGVQGVYEGASSSASRMSGSTTGAGTTAKWSAIRQSER